MTWLETMPWILGAIEVLVLLTLVVVWLENRRENEEYDERQKLIQGKAWHFSAMVGMVYYLALFACLELNWNLPLGTSMLLFIGLVIQVLCYHIYCVVRKAGLPMCQRTGRMIGIYAVLSVLQFCNFRKMQIYVKDYRLFITHFPDTDIPNPGNGELAWVCFIMSVTFACMAVLYFIALYRETRD